MVQTLSVSRPTSAQALDVVQSAGGRQLAETARACAAAMAIDWQPHLFSERIAATQQRLRQASRAGLPRASAAGSSSNAPVLQR